MQKIIISSTHGCEWHILLPLLKQLKNLTQSSSQQSIEHESISRVNSQNGSEQHELLAYDTDFDFYRDALMLEGLSDTNSLFILLYQSPAIGLMNAITQQGNSYQFLSDWMGSARCLTGFFKRNRKNCLVIDLEAARQDINSFATCLQQHGVETGDLDIPGLTIDNKASRPMNNYLVATLITKHHADVYDVFGELQACSSMQSDSKEFGLADAVTALKQIEHQNRHQNELLNQIHQHQQQLENIRTTWELKYNETLAHLENLTQQLEHEKSSNQKLLTEQSRIPELQQAINRLEYQLAESDQQNKEYNSENQLLILQIQQLQEELAQLESITQQLEQEKSSNQKLLAEQSRIPELQQKIDKLEHNLAEIDQQNKEYDSENQLLTLQVQQLQEELEQTFLEAKSQGEQAKESQSSLQQKDQQIKQLQTEIDTLKNNPRADTSPVTELESENELLLLQVAQLQEELEHYFLDNEAKEKQIRTLKKKQVVSNSTNIPDKTGKKVNKNHLRILFHADWYRKTAGKHMRPLSHYLHKGWKKGLSPHPLFDPTYYLKANELESLNMNPLLHFLSQGAKLDMSPHPLFDIEWYLNRYPDVAESGMNPLVHFIKFGFAEGRDPSPKFNSRWYLDTYPDVREAGMNPLLHYVTSGQAEGRQIMHSY
ncbi:hypothetical protein [Gynuella sp.]|uniref:hypothetical protein n=1 Tax=Gynuella sp. TaxID=2969146 RepID=UPI003D0F56A0